MMMAALLYCPSHLNQRHEGMEVQLAKETELKSPNKSACDTPTRESSLITLPGNVKIWGVGDSSKFVGFLLPGGIFYHITRGVSF
jgi:hypothetical protein